MRDDDSFLAFVVDALRPWAAVRVRRMFGAAGLFRDGTMFGFVADDTLYLKVGESNRAEFDAAGSRSFEYDARGKRMTLSYRSAPDAALDDEEALRACVDGAWTVARAAAARASKSPRRAGAKADSGGKKARR